MEKHVELMLDIQKIQIVIVMTLAYVMVWNDHVMMNYFEHYQIHTLLGTLNMPINDEYSSYKNTKTIMQFLLVVSMQLKNYQLISKLNHLFLSFCWLIYQHNELWSNTWLYMCLLTIQRWQMATNYFIFCGTFVFGKGNQVKVMYMNPYLI